MTGLDYTKVNYHVLKNGSHLRGERNGIIGNLLEGVLLQKN